LRRALAPAVADDAGQRQRGEKNGDDDGRDKGPRNVPFAEELHGVPDVFRFVLSAGRDKRPVRIA